MLLENGELRRIRLGNKEVIRRIYTSVRGPTWETISGELSEQSVENRPDSFLASYNLVHKQGPYDFSWKVRIEGHSDGRLRFEALGQSEGTFHANRIAICLLHPLNECVGRPVRLKGKDAVLREGHFPETINPRQPFLDFQFFSYELEPNLWASLHFKGDTFEMEDQRNWSDGSFKTYCPPADKPKPFKVDVGWKTDQSVHLEIEGLKRLFPNPLSDLIANPIPNPILKLGLRLGKSAGKPVPLWGFGCASHGHSLAKGDIARIKNLSPTHLRANFRLSHPSYLADLEKAVAESKALDIPLEVGLFIPKENKEDALVAFAEAWIRTGGKAIRWLVFSEQVDSINPHELELAIQILKPLNPAATFAIGSKGDFVLLNRNRPDLGGDTELVFAMTPQVHLFDNRTLVESLQGQEWILKTTALIGPKKKWNISSISIPRAHLALALKKGNERVPDDFWKVQVDTRQFSLLGAGWTLGTLKRLALNNYGSGLSSTFYETSGMLGVLSGASLSTEDLTIPNSDMQLDRAWVYPLYHVFADFVEFKGGEVHDLESDEPLCFDGVMLRRGMKRSILIANLEEKPGKVTLESMGRVLGLASFRAACVK